MRLGLPRKKQLNKQVVMNEIAYFSEGSDSLEFTIPTTTDPMR
jgi:hypothetical protein